MAVGERQTDVPALRSLAESPGGHLSTSQLRDKVQKYFRDDLGQWNILSNRDAGRNIVHLDLVRLQVKYDDGDWFDFHARLDKQGPQPQQRLRITERGRLLVTGLPRDATMLPDSFEEIIVAEEAKLRERLDEASEIIRLPDVADDEAAPQEDNIPENPPRPSVAGEFQADPEARLQAQERRSSGHHTLVVALNRRAEAAGLGCTRTKYADALVRMSEFGGIFEMKTVAPDLHDLVRQLRGAIGQLYHYRFLHRKTRGFEHGVHLYGVFDVAMPRELADFLREINIGTIWYANGEFHGDPVSRRELPWLFS